MAQVSEQTKKIAYQTALSGQWKYIPIGVDNGSPYHPVSGGTRTAHIDGLTEPAAFALSEVLHEGLAEDVSVYYTGDGYSVHLSEAELDIAQASIGEAQRAAAIYTESASR